MKYVAAYLMAVLGGNESPSASDIENILSSVAIDVDSDILEKLLSEMEGKSPHEVIADGLTKLQSVPTGGGGGAAVAAGGAAPAAGGAAVAAEEAKEEEKKEEEEEEDEDMGFSLFD
ncbi:unnamed protein product [Vitrella brassicaformis CCMP3155]|uniref:60S acidic ribosomal protein P2 n=2 Tax=Vitrella brassicaformis TaxID=1169539 RepID=A0A0G4EZT9_VITBC|nr:unnamed protein product [Vitrella brassicaformis CCMP3155]|eukprot:CEM04555.1 unnamed protein product [Vitrella brassicaformis CCMP3155]